MQEQRTCTLSSFKNLIGAVGGEGVKWGWGSEAGEGCLLGPERRSSTLVALKTNGWVGGRGLEKGERRVWGHQDTRAGKW